MLQKRLPLKILFQKINNNWNHYKVSNPQKKFLLLNYIVWILIYRRLLCYLMAFVLLGVYFILYPFVKFRLILLVGGSIGHYALNTEFLLAKIDTLTDDKFINIFYLEHSLFEPAVCNEQLHKMWKRKIFILPKQCSGIALILDRLLMRLLGNKAYGMMGAKKLYQERWGRDTDGYLKNTPIHLSFTLEEHQFAKEQLKKINIKDTDRYICLLVRSGAYNKGHPTWDRPHRNADLASYMKAVSFLAEKGYCVLRMGKQVDDDFISSCPGVIDYAASNIRSDFMDIYLSAHCHFFISTGAGLDGVAQIFRRPVLCTNYYMLSYVDSWYPHYLFTSKLVKYRSTQQLLSFKETFYYLNDNDYHTDPVFDFFDIGDYMQKHDLELVDNTENELLDVVEEMEARVSGHWLETENERNLQARFWTVFPSRTLEHNRKTLIHGDIDIKIGAKFLARYQHLLHDDRQRLPR